MSSDIDQVITALGGAGQKKIEAAFRKAIGNAESVAKDLCPVGHYFRKRGSGGKAGGDLRQSLSVEFVGKRGNDLVARCVSPLPYARRQHDEEFFHPGLYTGSGGTKFAAKYFSRAVEIIFGSGKDPAGDPLNQLGAVPAGFKDLLED